MPKKRIDWVIVMINGHVIWIEKKDVKDIKIVGEVNNGTSNTKLYAVYLTDGKVIPQCALRNEKVYEEFNKKDLTKQK